MNYRIEFRSRFLKGMLVLAVAAVMLLSMFGVSADVGTLDVNVIDESFEDGVAWPDGWDHYITNGGNTWVLMGDQTHTGAYSAYCPSTSQAQDEWLVSPEIELDDSWEEVTLSFWCYTKITWPTDGGTVRVFVGEPSMFTTLPGLPPDPDDAIWDKLQDEYYDGDSDLWADYAWREKVFDLSEFVGSTVRIAWNYVDEGKQQRFYLDDILVTTPGFVPKTTLRIGAFSGAGGGVSAEIENTGNISAEVVNWSMSIVGGFLGRIGSVSQGGIDEIDPGESGFASVGGFFGLGRVTVEVTVEASNTNPSEISRNATGFVFLNRFLPILV